MHVLLTKLLNDERIDVRFESTSTETNDNDSNDHGAKGTTLIADNGGDGRHNQDDMTDDIDPESPADGFIATPVLISNIGTEKGHKVLPELVEGGDSGRGALTHAESTRLFRVSTRGRAFGELLLNEIRDFMG